MKVDSIQGNERRQNLLSTITRGAGIGAISGYVLKYTYPLTTEEKNTDEYIKVSQKIHKQKTAYNFRTQKYIDSLKTQEEKSFAQNQFIKLFDKLKEGDHVKKTSIRDALKAIKEQKPKELFEFKKLCKASSEIAELTAKQAMNAYNLLTRHNRPTGFFLITGAIAGAIIATLNSIIKVEQY